MKRQGRLSASPICQSLANQTTRRAWTPTKQITIRLPDDLTDEAEAVPRVHGTGVNALIGGARRVDKDFVARARKLLERDKEILDLLRR